jgi:hypothetical protein
MKIPILLFLLTVVGLVLDKHKKLSRKKYVKRAGVVVIVISSIFGLWADWRSKIDFDMVQLTLTNTTRTLEETRHSLEETHDVLEMTRKYSKMATYGLYGGEQFFGPGLGTTDRLYNLMSLTYYTDNDKKVHFRCGEPFESTYRTVTAQ